MNFLKIKFSVKGDDFIVEAESPDEDFEKSFHIEEKKDEIISKFDFLYDIIENKKEDEEEEFKKAIRYLSDLLIKPIEGEVHDSKKIRIIADYELVRCAFDLLEAKGSPIFLRSEVSYMVEDEDAEENPELELNSILSISDVTADPERACETAKDMFDENEYYDVKNANLKMITKANTDVLLVSAHGDLDDENSGEIEINGESLTSDELENIDTTLVYFDSCQQGVNTDFLETFQEEETTSYYLAPITSNDAGDSSTYTMNWFFEDLQKEGNPISSLFHTKKKLHELYKNKNLNHITVLNKAAIFRIYEFASEED